jgi:hypothetical protein
MRLKNKIRYVKRPQPGDVRVVTRFAWLPVVMDNDKTVKVWLERYKVIQTFVNKGSYNSSFCWVDNSRWDEDICIPMETKLDPRSLVKERRRIKKAMEE